MRYTAPCLAVILAASLAACGGSEEEGGATTDEPIVIGAIAPLTGPASAVGVGLMNPLRLWVKQVNADGGINGREVKLVECNDEAQPQRGVTCARDLIAQDVSLIANNSLTGSIEAVLPLVQESGPVMIMPSPNTAPKADEYPYVFQTSPSDRDLTQALANFLGESDVDSVGMVAATDASSQIALENAETILPSEGIDLQVERIEVQETNAGVQIAALANAGVDVVYSNFTGAGAATVVKSFVDSSLTVPLVINYGNLSDAFLGQIAGSIPPRLMGLAVSSILGPDGLESPEEIERYEEFVAAYEDEYGQAPDMINLLGYSVGDAIEVALTAEDVTDADSIKAVLESTEIESVQNFAWSEDDHVGLDAESATVVELKDGVWSLPDPIK